MNSVDDLDPTLATRLRIFAGQSLSSFSAERTAAAAMLPDRPSPWWLVTGIAAGVAVVVAVVAANNLAREGPSSGSPSISASMQSSTTLAQSPSSAPTSTGLTQEEAVAIARGVVPPERAIEVLYAVAGPAGEVLSPGEEDFAGEIPPDRWVWRIILSDGGPSLGAIGSIVVIDYFDGHVYGSMNWIS
jgi:hypothetical protein